jgi:hypothetical protein
MLHSSKQLIIEPPSVSLFIPIQLFNDPFPFAFIEVEQLAFPLTIVLVTIFIKRPISLVEFAITVVTKLIAFILVEHPLQLLLL